MNLPGHRQTRGPLRHQGRGDGLAFQDRGPGRRHRGCRWITRAEGTELTAVDAASGRVVGSTTAGDSPAVAADAAWLTKVDAGTIARIPLGKPAAGAATAPGR